MKICAICVEHPTTGLRHLRETHHDGKICGICVEHPTTGLRILRETHHAVKICGICACTLRRVSVICGKCSTGAVPKKTLHPETNLSIIN